MARAVVTEPLLNEGGTSTVLSPVSLQDAACPWSIPAQLHKDLATWSLLQLVRRCLNAWLTWLLHIKSQRFMHDSTNHSFISGGMLTFVAGNAHLSTPHTSVTLRSETECIGQQDVLSFTRSPACDSKGRFLLARSRSFALNSGARPPHLASSFTLCTQHLCACPGTKPLEWKIEKL